MENVFSDATTIEELFGMLAGAASLCWEESPQSVFDSEKAKEFVDQAISRFQEMHTSPFDDSLHGDLRHVFNKHSVENGANIPDNILATYTIECVKALNTAVRRQNNFFGFKFEFPFDNPPEETNEPT